MSRFLIRILLFSAGILLIFIIGLALPDNAHRQNLHYALIDKVNLLENVPSPRIILVGGSNLSFGIDSRKVRDELNINVVNTAINAGYGIKYLLDVVKPYIKAGDIVLVSIEYQQFFGNAVWGGMTLLRSIDAVPKYISLLNFRQWLRLLRFLPKYALSKIKLYVLNVMTPKQDDKELGVYERRSFNDFGDVFVHWTKEKTEFDSSISISENFNPRSILILKSFEKEINKMGTKLVFAYPCLARNSLNEQKNKIELVEKTIIESGLTVIGTPERYSFGEEMYYNTAYHANRDGVELRTQRLIEDLKSAGIVKSR